MRFTGKERDAETGLDYFGARYLSAAQGRFTSPDVPFADQHSEEPQSWTLYGYVRNGPLSHTDPTGMSCVHRTNPDGSMTTMDNGDGKGCEDLKQGNSVNVKSQQGSLLDLLTASDVPRYVPNDVELSEKARKVLGRTGQDTRFIVDTGDKIGGCVGQEVLGVPMVAPGLAGAGMTVAGQPFLPTRAKFGSNPVNILGGQSGIHPSILVESKLPTRGTSVASVASRRLLGKTAGRTVGRAIPFVGVGVLAADVVAIGVCALH